MYGSKPTSKEGGAGESGVTNGTSNRSRSIYNGSGQNGAAEAHSAEGKTAKTTVRASMTHKTLITRRPEQTTRSTETADQSRATRKGSAAPSTKPAQGAKRNVGEKARTADSRLQAPDQTPP